VDRCDAGRGARLKAVCNIAVGYNTSTSRPAPSEHPRDEYAGRARRYDRRHDLGAAHGLCARVTEAERWLRPGTGRVGKNDQFLGVDVHHATLGVIGMGRIGQALARRAKGFLDARPLP